MAVVTIPEALKTVLAADTTLLTVVTGGVYTWDETGRNGISPQSVPGAYDTNLLLKPTAIIRQRSEQPWGYSDKAAQQDSMRDMIEVYLYADSAESFNLLETPMLRTLRLLHNQDIPNAGRVRQVYRYDDRDERLDNAIYIRLDFQIVRGRRLT